MQGQLEHQHLLEIINKQVDYKNQLLELIRMAKKQGATQVEASIHHDTGFSVSVRIQDVETIEHNRNTSLGITVYFDYAQ